MSGASVRCVGLVHVYSVAGVDVAALRGADLRVAPGERLALLGPSGSGKSTLLSIVAGLRRPSAGQVLVDGTDISRWSERQLYGYRSETVGVVLQGALSNLVGHADPTQNVAYAARRRDRPARSGARVEADATPAATDVLELAGLARERRPVVQLGRTAQQVVAVAVGLASRPRMLLVDEPTSQLDRASRDDVLDVLVEATRASGTTLLAVTHDEEVAGRMQRLVRMRDGRVASEGDRDTQRAIVGADGSIPLPEELAQEWPPGSSVRVVRSGPDRLEVVREPTDEPGEHGSGDHESGEQR